jgi:hypothetical protein
MSPPVTASPAFPVNVHAVPANHQTNTAFEINGVILLCLRLNTEFNAGLAKSKLRHGLPKWVAQSLSAADYGKLIPDETEKWAKAHGDNDESTFHNVGGYSRFVLPAIACADI